MWGKCKLHDLCTQFRDFRCIISSTTQTLYKVLSVIVCENVIVLQSSYKREKGKLNFKGNIRRLSYVNEHMKLSSKISSMINRSGAFGNFWQLIQSLFMRNYFLNIEIHYDNLLTT